MKVFIRSLFAFLVFTSTVSLAQSHSHPQPTPQQPKVTPEEVCLGEGEQEICAHIHFAKTPDSVNESTFILHFQTPNNVEIQNLKVELWMEMEGGHGHGSAPVSMQRVSMNKYKISNAWFIMIGSWTIKTHFDLDTQHHALNIPVNILE